MVVKVMGFLHDKIFNNNLHPTSLSLIDSSAFYLVSGDRSGLSPPGLITWSIDS